MLPFDTLLVATPDLTAVGTPRHLPGTAGLCGFFAWFAGTSMLKADLGTGSNACGCTTVDGMLGAVDGVPASGAADRTVGGAVSGAARGVVTDAGIGAVKGVG